MRILHIIPSYLPAKLASGAIKPTHYLNKALVEKGIEVVVYTMNIDGNKKLDVPLGKEVNLDGVKVFYFPMTFRPWQYSYKLHQALAKSVKDFDLIHITSVFLSVSTLGAYYAKKFNKPYIISPHGSLMNEPLRNRNTKKQIYISLIERKNLTDASAIHFTVETEKEEYIKAGLSLKKTIIIPNGLDIEEFNTITRDSATHFKEKFGIAPDKKIILFLGRLHRIKGLDTLIPAFAEIIKKEPKAVLVLAGPDDENYKREVLKFIDEVNLRTSDIVFTGMLVGEDKTAVYKESDVFVLPSYSENFGMVVVEAMYSCLPVVITKYVGIAPEIIKNNAGIVIKKSEKELTEAILKILNNPALAQKMGESGKRLVETEFSPGKIADKWIEKYKNIIKNV